MSSRSVYVHKYDTVFILRVLDVGRGGQVLSHKYTVCVCVCVKWVMTIVNW